jgi:hypothetical protein
VIALRWIIALVLPALFLEDAAFAQAPPDGRFALKPSWKQGYVIVPDSGGSTYIDCSTVARVAGWDTGHPNERRPSTLEIAYKVNGDAVVMTATAFFGVKADVNDTPETLARRPRKLVGTYSAHLNESVTLSGMTELGMEPLSVQVVTGKDLGAGQPTFISEAPSIQIEVTDQNREFFTLALHNTSSRAVTGYAICTQPRPGDAHCSGSEGGGIHPVLIAAGGTLTIPYYMSHSGRETPNGFVADPDPTTVVLKGAVFADGTIEGMGLRPITPEGARELAK